jgi:hypothetical protein
VLNDIGGKDKRKGKWKNDSSIIKLVYFTHKFCPLTGTELEDP